MFPVTPHTREVAVPNSAYTSVGFVISEGVYFTFCGGLDVFEISSEFNAHLLLESD